MNGISNIIYERAADFGAPTIDMAALNARSLILDEDQVFVPRSWADEDWAESLLQVRTVPTTAAAAPKPATAGKTSTPAVAGAGSGTASVHSSGLSDKAPTAAGSHADGGLPSAITGAEAAQKLYQGAAKHVDMYLFVPDGHGHGALVPLDAQTMSLIEKATAGAAAAAAGGAHATAHGQALAHGAAAHSHSDALGTHHSLAAGKVKRSADVHTASAVPAAGVPASVTSTGLATGGTLSSTGSKTTTHGANSGLPVHSGTKTTDSATGAHVAGTIGKGTTLSHADTVKGSNAEIATTGSGAKLSNAAGHAGHGGQGQLYWHKTGKDGKSHLVPLTAAERAAYQKGHLTGGVAGKDHVHIHGHGHGQDGVAGKTTTSGGLEATTKGGIAAVGSKKEGTLSSGKTGTDKVSSSGSLPSSAGTGVGSEKALTGTSHEAVGTASTKTAPTTSTLTGKTSTHTAGAAAAARRAFPTSANNEDLLSASFLNRRGDASLTAYADLDALLAAMRRRRDVEASSAAGYAVRREMY